MYSAYAVSLTPAELYAPTVACYLAAESQGQQSLYRCELKAHLIQNVHAKRLATSKNAYLSTPSDPLHVVPSPSPSAAYPTGQGLLCAQKVTLREGQPTLIPHPHPLVAPSVEIRNRDSPLRKGRLRE